jgi:Arc/MetJ-type ribon-helix-helix transcriptional regulator
MYDEPKMEKLTINLPPVEIGRIDLLIEGGLYPTRTEFIRSAIRKALDNHEDYLDERVSKLKAEVIGVQGEKNLNTNIFGIGVFSITKEKLTQALKLNEKIKIFVIGLVIMDKKITANLIDKAVEKVRIFGVIKAPKEVKKAMERKR